MSWTFHQAECTQPTARARAERRESDLRHLQQREAGLVRHLVALRERHAFYPNAVTERQVTELAAKLEQLRARIDDLRAEHGIRH